jgi:hypothetical protein
VSGGQHQAIRAEEKAASEAVAALDHDGAIRHGLEVSRQLQSCRLATSEGLDGVRGFTRQSQLLFIQQLFETR